MCTVTFVPTADGFIFTSNRDEDPKRAAKKVVKEQRQNHKIYYPQDEKAKGTWIAFSNNNRFACVLNGAFQPHQPKGKYRLSRGKMALAFFDYPNNDVFLDTFDFDGIEAFTLILYHQGDFKEVKWDEKEMHVRDLPLNTSHLWSSCTLYTEEWWLDRSIDFKEFVARNNPNQTEIIDFHAKELPFVHSALEARLESSIPMSQIPLKTTSISSLAKVKKGFDFYFQRTDGTLKVHKSTF